MQKETFVKERDGEKKIGMQSKKPEAEPGMVSMVNTVEKIHADRPEQRAEIKLLERSSESPKASRTCLRPIGKPQEEIHEPHRGDQEDRALGTSDPETALDTGPAMRAGEGTAGATTRDVTAILTIEDAVNTGRTIGEDEEKEEDDLDTPTGDTSAVNHMSRKKKRKTRR